ncbi:XAC0095 family protein [Luteimonas saliphila]|uniref:XAC0095 family protein n=1 Tax=Luteimonas saliphila TaxID=2804919 RepID=UPI00192DA7F6|nr:hypothetical protein [Luteimonas saliphila]
MSEHALDQGKTRGYLLSEDGQFRLRKLHGHMVFLSQLAQPRTRDEEDDDAPEVSMGELAVCLELLAEQAAQVLEQATWPARHERVHDKTTTAPEAGGIADEAPSAAAAEHDEADEDAVDAEAGTGARYVFGLTMDQADALDRLLARITALGDVVFNTDEEGLADGSLQTLAHAIFDDAQAMEAILDQVGAQPLRTARKPSGGVRETPAAYHAGPAAQAARDVRETAQPLAIAGQRRGHAPVPALRLH